MPVRASPARAAQARSRKIASVGFAGQRGRVLQTPTRHAEPVRVSIVIPCYNRAALVGDAIASAVEHGDGAEIIVIDDGSTDTSWERISSFGERVRGLRIANGGVSAARNFGVSQASGTHIKFLDSDDRLPRGGVSALVEALHTVEPHQIVFGDTNSIGAYGEAIAPIGYGYADAASPGPLPRAMLLSRVMSPFLPLYPVAALRRVGGFDPAYSLGEDQELAVRLVLAGYRFYRVPTPPMAPEITKVAEEEDTAGN